MPQSQIKELCNITHFQYTFVQYYTFSIYIYPSQIVNTCHHNAKLGNIISGNLRQSDHILGVKEVMEK